MGASNTKHARNKTTTTPTFKPILDSYETLEDVQAGLQQAGLESSQLIMAVDFTKSNEWTGRKSFAGNCLHSLSAGVNPYQEAMSVISRTLSAFDDDRRIPCYGFGDVTTGDASVFSFFPDSASAQGIDGVLSRYEQVAPHVTLSGPTSFAPAIRQAMRIVADSGNSYHILLLLADGQVTPTCLNDTVQAIVAASHLPLSIVMVGVGDGPWDRMQHFDDQLPARKFDNFQFVDFHKVKAEAGVYSDLHKREAHFAMNALMEIPEQYKTIMKLGLMEKHRQHNSKLWMAAKVQPPPPEVIQADMAAMANIGMASAPPLLN